MVVMLSLTLLLGISLSACSSDDESDDKSRFDSSQLLGYWVAVQGGIPLNHGVWFSDEKIAEGSDAKIAKFWWRKDETDNLHRTETTYWDKNVESGRIDIWMWEGGRTVVSLSQDRLVISSSWLYSEPEETEYRRMEWYNGIED